MTTVQSMLFGTGSFPFSGNFLRFTLTFAAVACMLGGVLRLLLGRDSAVVHSLSSCIVIALVYWTVITGCALMPDFFGRLRLPFLTVSPDAARPMEPSSLLPIACYPELLRLFLLAFLCNLLEDILPRGEKFLPWLFFRSVSLYGTLGLYGCICLLTQQYAPQIFGILAQPILIFLCGLILTLALYKGLLALTAAAANPLLALLFTFFFSNVVGKQLGKSISACVLVSAVFSLLAKYGFYGFAFSQFSPAEFGPYCIVLLSASFVFRNFL